MSCFVSSVPLFRLEVKENIHCHPTFIIRDINIYRNSYSKGLLKSRESDHCCYNIKIVFKIHHTPPTTPPSLTETLKSQRLASLNLVDMSCMVIQIVPLDIVKDGGMFCGGL